VISSITATLFGYDEFILREVSAESLLAATPPHAKTALDDHEGGADCSSLSSESPLAEQPQLSPRPEARRTRVWMPRRPFGVSSQSWFASEPLRRSLYKPQV
jgi:hypothetical protein